MALNQKIRLQIISALDDAGIKATADQLDKLQAKVVEAETAAQGLGREFKASFNPMEAILQLAHGNVEGVTKSLVQMGLAAKGVAISVGTMTAAFGGIMLAVTGVRKLIEMFQEQKRAAKEAADATAKAFQTNIKNSITAFQAEYKLAMEKSADPTKTRKQFIEREKREIEAMGNQLASYEKQATDKIAKQRKKFENEISAEIAAMNPGITPEELRKATYSEGNIRRVNKLMNGGVRAIGKNGDVSVTPIKGWIKEHSDELYDKEINALVDAIKTKSANINALEQEAADEQKRLADERAKNEADMAARIKKIQEDAKMEEMKLEEKRHQERMKNLEAEARAANGNLNAAQSRFEREFALYKSGNAAAQIEAEKQDEEARKRLAKDAARYGGKWRIDALSKLYAAGDEEGVKTTLADWRKSSRFTPEVEAMVRAAAAQDNVKTMEDRVSEIAENTRNLAEKVDELISMKGE